MALSKDFQLPMEEVDAEGINPRILLIHGTFKIGKTELIRSLIETGDKYLLIDLEDGTYYTKAIKVKIESLEDLNELGDKIIEANKPYKYIIIDSVTELAFLCEEYATLLYKNSNLGKGFKGENVIGELSHGAGYYWLRRAFAIWFKYIRTLAPRIILLGHPKESALVDDKGEEILGRHEVTVANIDLTGKLKAIVCSRVDAIGYLYRRTTGVDKETRKEISELRINFCAGSSILGGSRPLHLRGEDIVFDWKKIYLEENK